MNATLRTTLMAVAAGSALLLALASMGGRDAWAATTDTQTLFLGATSADTGPSSAADIIYTQGQLIHNANRIHFYFLKNVLAGPYHHLETGYAYIGSGHYEWFTEFWGWTASSVSCPQEIPRSGSHVDISSTIRQCWGNPADSFLGVDGNAHYYRHISLFGQWGAQACGSTNPGGSSTGCMNIGQVATGGFDTPTETTVLFESNGTGGPVDTVDNVSGNFFSLERWNTATGAFQEVSSARVAVTGSYVGGAPFFDWPASPHSTLCPPWGVATNVFGNYHWLTVGNWALASCVPSGTTIW